MSGVKIVEMPVEMHIVPLKQVGIAWKCSERTAAERFDKLDTPIVRFGRSRGVFVADLLRLVTKIHRRSPLAGLCEVVPGQ